MNSAAAKQHLVYSGIAALRKQAPLIYGFIKLSIKNQTFSTHFMLLHF